MFDIQKLDQQLNELVLAGKAIEAMETFYADDVVMQENTAEPTRGKAANLEREKEFFGNVETVHEMKILAGAAAGDVSFAEMVIDATLKNGERMKMSEVARRQWKDGKIVHERFYYDS